MPHVVSASADDFHFSTKLSFAGLSHRYSEDALLLSRKVQATGRPTRTKTDRSQQSFTGGLPSPPASESGEAETLTLETNDEQQFSAMGLPRTPVSDTESRKTINSFPFPRTPTPEFQTDSRIALLPTTRTLSGAGKHVEDLDAFPFPLEPLHDRVFDLGAREDRGRRQDSKQRCVSAVAKLFTPPASPDRYISSRYSPQARSSTFRTSKSPQELSGTERLLRQNSASPDPFRSPTRLREGTRVGSGSNNGQQSRSPSRSLSGPTVLGLHRSPLIVQNRQASAGAVWAVGGSTAASPTGPVQGLPNGRGGVIGSGTNAPMYTSRFLDGETPDRDLERLEGRLAAALDIDQTSRMLDIPGSPKKAGHVSTGSLASKRRYPFIDSRTRWEHGAWVQEGAPSLLDAPQLRDDFYCSVLAYCHTSRTLAVGLSNRVYLWSETFGVQYPRMEETDRRNTYVTSLSFSSTEGGHSILAMGRNDGQISLWSLFDDDARFQSRQPSAIACVAFKPVITRKPSERFSSTVEVEELLVGDEAGNIHYYSVEWLSNRDVDIHGWQGGLTLIAKISVHTQQICGLAWSPDGEYFATGANDNACCLFEVKDILTPPKSLHSLTPVQRYPLQELMTDFGLPNPVRSSTSEQKITSILGDGWREHHNLQMTQTHSPLPSVVLPRTRYTQSHQNTLFIGEGRQKHKWLHSAAIKAIAFCPWQRGLIATGGGSNDRAIHFYHTFSGACLATINVQAQVTSLIWSTSRREIAATFGYAQPEHPYRIAVFSWPDCRQVVAIPWASEMRALLAIPYPGGPNEMGRQVREGERWLGRTAEEGCIVVACSDESVKFHEVWSGSRKSTGGNLGLLGGSDILEGLEGIEREGKEVIR